MNRKTAMAWAMLLAVTATLSACGGGKKPTPPTPTTTYTVGGTITGLTSAGLVLQINGGNNLTAASGATTFTSSNSLASGAAYAVTVLTQPSSQTCTVANGAGTVGTTNVTNVAVTCTTPPPTTYTIGGTVTGLTSSGLVLQVNGANNISVASGATTFTSSNSLTTGAAYAVTVLTQPATQNCTVASGSGAVAGANVTNVAITCVTPPPTFTVGGSISGLTTSGLVLQVNGANNITVASGATTFTSSNALLTGAAYAVTVLTQPATQICNVANGAGTVASANVTNVAVTCVSNYTVGVTVSGYTTSGLVLQLNGGNNLTPAAGNTTLQTFSPRLLNVAAYAVTVLTQPTNQVCTVSNGSGTVAGADVTNVTVSCASTYTVGVAVTGLSGSGLVLQLNGGNNLTPAATNSLQVFTPRLLTGAAYAVTVLTQPSNPAQQCTVANGSGTVAGANVTNATVTCALLHTLSGNVSGLTGTLGLTVALAGLNGVTAPPNQIITVPPAGTSFTLPVGLIGGVAFRVTVTTQPASQTCLVSHGAGVTEAMNISGITVTCAANLTSPLVGTYTLDGTTGTAVTFHDDGTYTMFYRTLDDGCINNDNQPLNAIEYGTYNWNSTTGAFDILNAPVDTSGECGLNNDEVGSSAIRTVAKSGNTLTLTSTEGSVTDTYGLTAAPSTSGQLVGSFRGVNGGYIAFSNDGTFMVVSTQGRPDGALNNGTFIGLENGCYTSTSTTVSLNVTAGCLPGGRAPVDTNGNAGFLFNGQARTLAYSVTGDTLVMGIAPNSTTHERIVVNAITPPPAPPGGTYTVGGTITGLTSSGLVLQLNNGNYMAVAAGTTSFTYNSALANAVPYAVTVLTQPSTPRQRCTVTNGSGTMGSANVTDIAISCVAATTYTVSGTVNGLTGTLQVGLFTGPTASETLILQPGTTAFTFNQQLATAVAFGTVITAQPNGQTCIVTRGAGLTATSDLSGTVITCVANAIAPLAGTFTGTSGSSYLAVTFTADGRYVLVLRQPDSDECRNNAGQLTSNGIEYGVYNWNSTTGQFRAVSAVVDTTGECGFLSDGGGAPFQGTLTRAGNVLTFGYTDDSGNPASFLLTAASNTTGQLLGTYEFPNGRYFTFFGDGTYLTTLTQGPMSGAPTNNYALGFEQGCYTTTSTTMTVNLSNTCILPSGKPAIDMNGSWPIRTGSALAGSFVYTLTGDALALFPAPFTFTITRIQSN